MYLNGRIYFFEKCVDKDIKRIFSVIQKFKKISTFVEEIYKIDKLIAKRFVEFLPSNILRIYNNEKENGEHHRQMLQFYSQNPYSTM